MFDIGWTELLLIGIVALIVVGPKDLPGMFRTLGRFTAKMRGMAREFQRSMDEAADQSGMRDVARDLRKMTSVREMGLDAVKGAVNLDTDDDAATQAKPVKGPQGAPATDAAEDERAAARRRIAERTATEAAAARAEAAATPPAPDKGEGA